MDHLTNDNLEFQWPLWGTFSLPMLVFLWTELEGHGNRTNNLNGIAILIGTWRLLEVFRILQLPFYKILLLSELKQISNERR